MQVGRQKRGGCKLKNRDRPCLCAIAHTRMMTARFKSQTATMRTVVKTVITGLDPVIHLLRKNSCEDGWMPGSRLRQGFAGLSMPGRRSFLAKAASPGMTSLFPRRDASELCPLNFRPSEDRRAGGKAGGPPALPPH